MMHNIQQRHSAYPVGAHQSCGRVTSYPALRAGAGVFRKGGAARAATACVAA